MDTLARPETSASLPLQPQQFDTLMGALGPFEPRPVVAVAVSGGADSMALMLLAAEWARRRGGRAIGLTVDHGLRAAAGAEASEVHGWLRARGIEHEILRWEGPKPARGIQARARAARYRLLEAWCRSQSVLHLLVAHHRDDQVETYVLRRRRGSGSDGLACMPAIRETHWIRVLRPLLGVPRARLRGTLLAAGQPWLEDPSNVDPSFERVRIRKEIGLRPDVAPEPGRVDRMATQRIRTEQETAGLLACCARMDPGGTCHVDREMLAGAKREFGMRALARILMCVGGNAYPPRQARLARLYDEIVREGPAAARTLGGCLVSPRDGFLVVSREPGKQGTKNIPRGAPEVPIRPIHPLSGAGFSVV